MNKLKSSYPCYVASEPCFSASSINVTNKYTGEVVSNVSIADTTMIDSAIEAAERAQSEMAALAPYERQAILQQCINAFKQRADELAYALCIEAGKPINDARGEVSRLIDTFAIAAEEAVRIEGERINLAISPRAKGYEGMTKKVPIGPCSLISPFNFPLNLAAHKVAPAIAAGCTFVLKPASLTPISALIMGEILSKTDLPKGAFSILPCKRSDADLFTTDDRLKLLSFTGSPDVGWALKAKAGKKPVVLELGGNAAVVIDHDADLKDAVERVVIGAFYQSGQSCISVQRILVHIDVYDEFKAVLVQQVSQLVHGDPLNEDTFIGPMITESEASRLKQWIDEAINAGASCLCGGEQEGSMLQATLLENVAPHLNASAEEAFGPLAILQKFSTFDEALQQVNNSRYGLQAGIFTRDIYKAHKAWNTLNVGGVIIGDVPSWRVDNMPYGGVKDSGIGREGIRYAIEDMTETRLLVLRTPPSA